MSDIPRVTIEAKPEDVPLAGQFAARLASPDYEWARDGFAELYVVGNSGDMLFKGRPTKGGVAVKAFYR